jgi:hypothetical protein
MLLCEDCGKRLTRDEVADHTCVHMCPWVPVSRAFFERLRTIGQKTSCTIPMLVNTALRQFCEDLEAKLGTGDGATCP